VFASIEAKSSTTVKILQEEISRLNNPTRKITVLISAGFGWFRLVYVRGKKLKEAERSEANGVKN